MKIALIDALLVSAVVLFAFAVSGFIAWDWSVPGWSEERRAATTFIAILVSMFVVACRREVVR